MPIQTARLRNTIGAFLAAMVLLHAVYFWHARHLIAQRYPDFTAFYAAGLIVRSGMGHRLYDPKLQARIEREKIGRETTIAPLPILRPPFEALAFVPFSFLPYLAAFAVWSGFNVVLLLSWIRIMRREIGVLRDLSPGYWALIVLGFFPIFLNLQTGQDSIPFLLLVTLAFSKLKNDHPFSAGVWLGLAAFKPQMLLPLVLILLFRPQRSKLILGCLVSGCTVLLISVGVSGWGSVLHYPQYLLEVNRELGIGTITPSDMPNLRGLAALLGNGGHPVLVGAASFLIVILAGSSWLMAAKEDLDSDAVWCMAIVAALMASYHTHVYDLALLILPISLRLDRFLKAGEFRNHAAEVGVIGILFVSPVYAALIGHGFASLIALPVLLFGLLAGISGGSRIRESIRPSMGM